MSFLEDDRTVQALPPDRANQPLHTGILPGEIELRSAVLRFPRNHALGLDEDWDPMVTFHGFPKQRSQHLPTMNISETPFAASRLATAAATRFKKVVKSLR